MMSFRLKPDSEAKPAKLYTEEDFSFFSKLNVINLAPNVKVQLWHKSGASLKPMANGPTIGPAHTNIHWVQV